MNLGTAQVIRANSRHLPLADNSVDLICTSPPYFALRSYQDGGEHYAGQIGDEPTPAEFIASLLEVTRECVRVLKPSGSLWVNLGDKYAGRTGGPQGSSGARATRSQAATYEGMRSPKGSGFQAAPQSKQSTNPSKSGSAATRDDSQSGHMRPTILDKSLIGIPWRYALACIDDLGLILRAEVIWSKPNGLPESVTDRVRRSHEQWFHFSLEPRYFSAVDEIREAHVTPDAVTRIRTSDYAGPMSGAMNGAGNPLGKLPGSVWTVPTEPLRVPDHLGIDHFAAFPTEWPKRIIQGWSPAGVCVECGEGRRPVVQRGPQPPEPVRGGNRLAPGQAGNGTLGFRASKLSGQEWNEFRAANPDTITGYACACTNEAGDGMACGMPFKNPTHASHEYGHPRRQWCPGLLPDTRPAVVLDPFGGTGTTALVAKALGRHGITADMSADYCRLAEWRTNDRDQLAKVLGIAKADQQPEEQLSMLDLIDGGAA